MKICPPKPFRFLRILLVLLTVFWHTNASATHSAGSDITYRCLGGLTYEITVSFYRDCGGVAEPSSITINCRSATASANLQLTAMKVPGYGNEITLPCTGNATNCNGGSGTGIREWKYRTIVNLPSAQSDWVFSYSICCRNCSITTIQSPCAANSVLYVEARLNNLNGVCNNSPTFTNIPVAYVCLGQNYNYNHGVKDTDGDSLVYSLVTPKTSTSTTVTFIPPSSTTSPIVSSTPFLLNPVTGDLDFTPAQLQIGILAILVKEYRNGTLIGSVIRDMQVYISPCSNTLPTLSGINNTSSNTISACVGESVCFNLQSADPDSNQLITLTSNDAITGATYMVNSGLRPSMNFCWTPSPADAGTTKSFTVKVQDNACPFNGVQVYSYHIQVHNKLKLNSTGSQCGQAIGSVSVQPLSGNNGYQWSNGANTTTVNNLTPGTYTVTVTTEGGCTLNDSIAVTNQGLFLINGQSNTSCPVSCSGKIGLKPSGGVEPYTYSWANGDTTADLFNLCSGNYSVTVTDIYGCTADSVFMIENTITPSIQLQTTDQICEIPGSATIAVSGQYHPYSYLWSTGDTTTSIAQLFQGNYWVKITDDTGCDTTLTFSIIEISSPPALQFTSTPASCYGFGDGTITLQTANTCTYLWNTGATTSAISSLVAGNYTVTITDPSGCKNTDTILISEPASLHLSSVIIHPHCLKPDGSVQIQVFGGNIPYQYQWSNGQTTALLNGVSDGIYTITVTDVNHCSYKDSVILNSTNLIQLSLDISSPGCHGQSNGMAVINPYNGNAPYSILWSDGTTAPVRNDLTAGSYTISVTDSMQCTVVRSFIITEPPPIEYSKLTSNSDCINGLGGSATINPKGGVSGYNCVWADSVTGFNRFDLMPGTYTFTLRDSAGCNLTDTVFIIDSSHVTIQSLNSTTICMGEKAHLIAENLEDDLQFQWYYNGMQLKGAIKKEFYTPVAGIYTLEVTTSCGKFMSNEISVTIQKLDHLQISNEQLICPGESAELTVSGGVSYKWLPANGLKDSLSERITVTPSESTVYSVIVTDAEGCTALASVKVVVICDDTSIPSGFSPNNDGVNDYFMIDGIENHPGNVIYIYNRWGNLVFKQKEYDNRWNGESNVSGPLSGQQLPDGTYYFLLDLNNNQPPVSGYVMLRR
jgi:gliding motility-associated-like protein